MTTAHDGPLLARLGLPIENRRAEIVLLDPEQSLPTILCDDDLGSRRFRRGFRRSPPCLVRTATGAGARSSHLTAATSRHGLRRHWTTRVGGASSLQAFTRLYVQNQPARPMDRASRPHLTTASMAAREGVQDRATFVDGIASQLEHLSAVLGMTTTASRI